MGIITSLEPVTKTKYRVFIDQQFAFVLYRGELSHYGIRENMEIEHSLVEEILDETVYKHAKEQLNRMICDSDRTEKQVREKLKKMEFPESIIQKTIDIAYEYNFLDDERYAFQYVSCYADRKSRNRIRTELIQKGIPREILDRALDEQEPGQEREALYNLIRKKWRDRTELSFEEEQKLIGYLMRKGFSYDSVRRAIEDYPDIRDFV